MKQSLSLSNLGLIGAGAVGCALAKALSTAGNKFTVVLDRNGTAARDLAKTVQAPRAGSDFSLIAKDTRFLIIAVPDDQIETVDFHLNKHFPEMDLIGAAHTCGVLPGSVLKSLSRAGVPVGSLHPLQTFTAKGAPPTLKGVYFAIEGDEAIVPILVEVVEKMGGLPVIIPSEGKARYHAAAVFASNFIPVLLREARELMMTVEVPETQILPMLTPLMRASLDNCLKQGEAKALTGPVARGDAATVQRHLEALKTASPGTHAVYRMLSLKALELAVEKGLEVSTAEQLEKELTKR